MHYVLLSAVAVACGPAGYDIIQQVGEGGVYGQGSQGGGFVSTTNNRSMVVKCKGQGTVSGPGSGTGALGLRQHTA